MVDMAQLARESEDIAVVFYDQFRNIGNVLAGCIYTYEARAREAGDDELVRVFFREYGELRDVIEATNPSDIDAQARLMSEWRSVIRALRALP